jgi:preprotein translocase subunit YajC
VLFILPQQRRMRQHQQLVATLELGDDVVTAGGVFGTITSLDDEAVMLQVAPGVELRVLRGAVSRKVSPRGDIEPIDSAEAAALEAAHDDEDESEAWPSQDAAIDVDAEEEPRRDDGHTV